MMRIFLTLIITLCTAIPATPQTPTSNQPKPSEPPPVRRWFDLQNTHLWSRYLWGESSTGRQTASTLQWQTQVRGRFLLDSEARYSVGFNAHTGQQFIASWNNAGGGFGDFVGTFNVKQLYLTAIPLPGLELQVGGLHMVRGQNTEITSYDNDAFLVGERVTLKRAQGPVAQVAATVGHIGDFRRPNVFERFKHVDEWNYGQFLVGLRVGEYASVSADYTYEDGRDIIREGVGVRMPSGVRLLTALKLDAYQRVSDVAGQGFNVSGDLRLARRLTFTGGVAHVDRHYLAPGYAPLNADRFGVGSRIYSMATYAVTRDWSVQVFHSEAFDVDYDLPIEHRWEIVVMFNPTATLKAKGIF